MSMNSSFTVGDQPVEVAPFRVVVLGAFGAANRVSLDKDNFAAVLADSVCERVFSVHNHLGVQPRELIVRLCPRELRDFTPAGLRRALPELDRGLALRDALAGLRDGSSPRAEVDAALDRASDLPALVDPVRLALQADPPAAKAPPPPPPRVSSDKSSDAPDDNALGRLFEMVDTGSEAQPTSGALGGVISGIGGASSHSVADSGVAAAVEAAEAILSRQLDAVLHHPEVQACESAWRGLKLLVDHSDFRNGVQLEIVGATREELPEVMREHVVEPEERGEVPAPLSLIVVDVAVGSGSADITLLQSLGEYADRLQLPLICSADAGFFGLESGADLGTLPHIAQLVDAPPFDQWRSLRTKDASRWLALCCDRVLLRAPYTDGQRDAAGLCESARHHDDHLWGQPGWVLASLIAESFGRTGWGTQCTGQEDGKLGAFPVWSPERGQGAQIPSESVLSDQLCSDLAEAGLVAVCCRLNRDSAYVLRAPTVHESGAQLPYQLLVSRIADALARHKAALVAQPDPAAAFERFARGLVADTGPGAFAEASRHPDPDGDGEIIELSIRTGRDVLGGAEVVLSLGL